MTPSASWTRAQERDGAVHPAAHRDGDAPRVRRRLEGLAESGRERLDRERLAPHRCRLEERQADERLVEPGCVGRDDRVAVQLEPHRSPCIAARRVAEDLNAHRTRLLKAILDPQVGRSVDASVFDVSAIGIRNPGAAGRPVGRMRASSTCPRSAIRIRGLPILRK